MTMKAGRTLLLIAATLGWCSMLQGCWFLRGFGGWGSDDDDVGYSGSELSVVSGQQEGDMGYIAGHSGETFVQEGYTYDGYAHVRLETQGSDWWVMSLINVNGASLDELEPGVTYVATSGTVEGQDIEVDVTGCSGPTQGNYTYDTQATRVELEVEDLDDGARRVVFRTWYPDYETGGEQLTTGQFDYRTTH
jgi:hypothetical protein